MERTLLSAAVVVDGVAGKSAALLSLLSAISTPPDA